MACLYCKWQGSLMAKNHPSWCTIAVHVTSHLPLIFEEIRHKASIALSVTRMGFMINDTPVAFIHWMGTLNTLCNKCCRNFHINISEWSSTQDINTTIKKHRFGIVKPSDNNGYLLCVFVSVCNETKTKNNVPIDREPSSRNIRILMSTSNEKLKRKYHLTPSVNKLSLV
ncbi:hypothetical protein CBL_09549 [Carabus blaptoides fortunei]